MFQGHDIARICDKDPSTVRLDRSSVAPLAIGTLVALILLAGGSLIGATIWPRVVKVEQRVVAPAMNAAGFTPAIENLADMIGQRCPAIVAIRQDAQPTGTGTKAALPLERGPQVAHQTMPATLAGFLVSADGYLVTDSDGLADQDDIHVLLNDGRVLDAARVGSDPISGLALLRVEATGLPFLRFSTSNFPRVGEWAVALASPNGSGCAAALATISTDSLAEHADLRTYVRVRPVLEPALAGAALLNLNGDVVGIVGLGGQADDPDLASSVLTAATAGRIVSGLLRNTQPTNNRFGIVADDLLPALASRLGVDGQRGAVVSLIEKGSPADKGGLHAGDLILGVSGAPISGASELARALDTSEDALSLDVVRASKRLTISLGS
ncbi:MAG: trypsin-like peptidase domain-containing protein [Sphingomonas sp.]|jgi:serine protease Do|uniref:S1C family serine protease n=1 Tax=Sphingomonas sp. TaxID=28214 RepID=UPI0035627EAB